MVHIPNGILLSHIKETKIISFAAIWMGLEVITLSETSQKPKKQILRVVTDMWELNNVYMWMHSVEW